MSQTVRNIESGGELGNRGPWSQTYMGKRIHLLDPREEEIVITDIAWGLAHACRYAGQVGQMYTVAQHSVMVSHLVPPEFALEGLLHDAAEAYIGDQIRPVKEALRALGGGDAWDRIDDGLSRTIAARYGLVYPWPEAVHRADMVALATERRDVLHVDLMWTTHELPQPSRAVLIPEPPTEARGKFLRRFNELIQARGWEGEP